MRGRHGRLPSMQSLVGFEAAARLLSFSQAAEELHMTQSAVSHQIRSLEEGLGQALFRRQGRGVELTDAGRDLLETTRRSLATLSTGLNRLDFYTKPGSVVFSCPPGFARHWLLHRLPSLRQECPHIEPWIHTTDAGVDFEHSESDCFIACGDGHWPGLKSIELSREVLAPLCAPSVSSELGRSKRTSRLMDMPLLHDEGWEGGMHGWMQRGSRVRHRFAVSILVTTG